MNRPEAANRTGISLRFFSTKRGEHFLGNTSFFGLRYLSKFLPLSSVLFPLTGCHTIPHGIDDMKKRNFFGTASNCFGIIGRMMLLTKEMPPSERVIKAASPAMGLASLCQALQEGNHLIRQGFASHTALSMLMELINAFFLFKEPLNEDAILFLTMANLAFSAYSWIQQEETELRQAVASQYLSA